jgi:hypothetical protein
VVLKVSALEVSPSLERLWDEEDCQEERDDGAEKNEEEEEEIPAVVGPPSVQDPPIGQQPKEDVGCPQRVDPIESNAPSMLEHLAEARKDSGDAQGNDDGGRESDVLKRSHGNETPWSEAAYRL